MKSAHEELEKYVRGFTEIFLHKDNTNRRISFISACGAVGSYITPPASANNVWRWCKKSRVPNRRYHASILEITGIDFSKCDKKKVHGIPVKTVQAAKKAVETHLPVDFQDLQWVRTETPCVGCFIDGGSDECENVVRAITGQKGKSRGFVLKRKPTWEVCTKQNTKVGDVVRSRTTEKLFDVQYVLDSEPSRIMVVRDSDGLESPQRMELYEVEI